MPLLSEQLRRRGDPLRFAVWTQVTVRSASLLEWMDAQSAIRAILDKLRATVDVQALFADVRRRLPPEAGTPEEIAAVGLYLMEQCRDGKHIEDLALKLWLGGPDATNAQDFVDGAIRGYVEPLLDLVEGTLDEIESPPTPEFVTAQRIHEALSGRIALRYGETAEILRSTASLFEDTSEAGGWQNVGNSCREALITFASELRSHLPDNSFGDVKKGDVKGLIGAMAKPSAGSRFSSTLQDLVSSMWDHCASITHRRTTSREEAIRAFVWTFLAIAELSGADYDSRNGID